MLLKWLLLSLLYEIGSAKIIIIGAGPSGIAAATKLLENGITDLLVLEAEDRIGGRIKTIQFGAGFQDLGAQWCHGENNLVYELVQPLGLVEDTKVDFDAVKYINAKGEFLSTTKLNKLNFHFGEFPEMENAPLNSTYGQYFIEVFNNYTNQQEYEGMDSDLKKSLLDVFHLQILSQEASNSWFDLPIKSQLAYYEIKGSTFNSWKGRGYKTILDVLMKKLPDPSKELPLQDKILLSKEVTQINWDNEKNEVLVKCKDGFEYKGDRVIVTPSIGVLKSDYKSLFNPRLPQFKIDAIKGIGFGIVDKILIEFPNRWWNQSAGFIFVWAKMNDSLELQKLFAEDEWLRDILGFFSYDYQPNVLVGWILRDSARTMERLEETYVKDKVMRLIKLLLAKHYTIPEPVTFLRTQWDSNPHFRGSYSFNSVLMETLNTSNLNLAAPIRNSNNVEVLQFAGEATSTRDYATVHGAVESGWREADRILKGKKQ